MAYNWKTRKKGTIRQRGLKFKVENNPRGFSVKHKIQSSSILTRDELANLRKQYMLKGRRGRRNWILSMWKLRRSGHIDFSKEAENKKIGKPLVDSYYWNRSDERRVKDLIFYDMPRDDVSYFKGRSNRKIYVGSGSSVRRHIFRSSVNRIIKKNFTVDEEKAMGYLFFEGTKPSMRRAAGTCESILGGIGKRKHIITVDKKYIDNEHVITHELVHARRNSMGERWLDRDRDEKETELETLARISQVADFKGGYYQYIPEVRELIMSRKDYTEALKKFKEIDSINLTGSLKKSLKSKKARERVKEYYSSSQIAKAHFSPAESLDRYFIIKSNGVTSKLHVRYKRNTPISTIREDIKKNYGVNAEAWEIRDGKKVKILNSTRQ